MSADVTADCAVGAVKRHMGQAEKSIDSSRFDPSPIVDTFGPGFWLFFPDDRPPEQTREESEKLLYVFRDKETGEFFTEYSGNFMSTAEMAGTWTPIPIGQNATEIVERLFPVRRLSEALASSRATETDLRSTIKRMEKEMVSATQEHLKQRFALENDIRSLETTNSQMAHKLQKLQADIRRMRKPRQSTPRMAVSQVREAMPAYLL